MRAFPSFSMTYAMASHFDPRSRDYRSCDLFFLERNEEGEVGIGPMAGGAHSWRCTSLVGRGKPCLWG